MSAPFSSIAVLYCVKEMVNAKTNRQPVYMVDRWTIDTNTNKKDANKNSQKKIQIKKFGN